MSDRFNAKLRMYKRLLSVAKRNAALWQDVPAFTKAIAQLEAEVQAIEAMNPDLQADGSGSTEGKAKSKSLMIDETIRVSGVLLAYAHDINSPELAHDAQVTKTDFARVKELDADDLAMHVYQLAEKQLANLGEYAFDQAELDGFARLIETFSERIDQPREILSGTKEIRISQQGHFDAADQLIQNKLDNLIHSLKKRDARFFDAYQEARSVTRTGGKTAAEHEAKTST